MGETLDHLEKVIRDIPDGSFTVEPTNHIEKVIQEVGQEVIGMIPSQVVEKMYYHTVTLNFGNLIHNTTFVIVNNDETPFTQQSIYDLAKTHYTKGYGRYLTDFMYLNDWNNDYYLRCNYPTNTNKQWLSLSIKLTDGTTSVITQIPTITDEVSLKE